MKRTSLLAVAALLITSGVAQAELSIDTFDTTDQMVINPPAFGYVSLGSVSAPEAIGGVRSLEAIRASGAGLVIGQAGGGSASMSSEANTYGKLRITYDGTVKTVSGVNYRGLNGQDLTQAGANNGIDVAITSYDLPGNIIVTVYRTETDYASSTITLPAVNTGTASFNLFVRFSDFTVSPSSASTIDQIVHDVGAITVDADGSVVAMDCSFDYIVAKSDRPPGGAPSVSVNSETVCASGLPVALTATVTEGTAPFHYNWTGPIGTGPFADAATISATAAGEYDVIVTDANNQTTFGAGYVTVNPSPLVSVPSVSVKASALPATLTATVTGGTPTFHYIWTGPAGTGPFADAATISATVAGTYSVRVNDANGCSGTGSGTVTTTTCGSSLNCGDTATIGFWNNKNGQALIGCMPNSPALGNWLASNFPYLFGANAGAANNLTGASNSKVASYFKTLFKVSGTKTDAQVLAGALACYVTDSDLAGNKAAKYGFDVSTAGTGAKTYNVGSYGSAIGLQNNKSYTVFQLLQQANLREQQGTFNANAFNAIFDGINQKGDIK